jgi:hypothetical protein
MHFTVELNHNSPHMLWAGMTVTHLTGTYFFSGPVNAASYVEMLPQECLILLLRDRGLMKNAWLQHDRAPAYFTLNVLDTLNEQGCGHCSQSPVP